MLAPPPAPTTDECISPAPHDFTERIRTEKALATSEGRYRAAVESSADGIFINKGGRIVYANPALLRMLGADSPARVLGKSPFELIHSDYHALVRDRIRITTLDRRPVPFVEEKYVRLDGTTIDVEIAAAPFDEAGEVAVLVTARDLTGRKAAEAALRAERDRLARMAAVSPGVLHSFRLRPDGTMAFPYAAPGIVEIYGLRAEDLATDASPIVALCHPDDRARLAASVAASVREMSVWHCEFRVRHPVKGEIWVEGRSAPIREPDGSTLWHGVLNDITERKKAEEALRQREELLRTVIANIPCAVFWKDRDSVYLGCNDQVARDHDMGTAAALVGRTDYELGVPAAEADFYRACDRRVMETGEPLLDVEESQTRASGAAAVLLTSKVPLRDSAGAVVGVVGVYQDITGRKRAEAALRAAEKRLQHVITSSPAVLYTMRVEGSRLGGIAWISDNLRDMLGHDPAAAADPGWWRANVHPEDRDRVSAQEEADLFAWGRSVKEYRFRHADGTYRWTQDNTRLIRDPAGSSVEAVGSWLDITPQKQAEDQLRQAQKMEAVGRLAGGVAHDFNNLLTVINGYCDLLLGDLRPGDPLRGDLEQIAAAGSRGAALTRQLLTFSRKQVVVPELVDVNAVLREMEKMLARLIGEDVELTVTPAAGLGGVLADPGQIEQVVMNLAVNARDAMPRGGKLTVETANVELGETYTAGHPGTPPGRYVLVAVTDTGCGMPPELTARIFEPFFTTKGPELGTGLGLAVVHGIVQQCGGRIEVYSEPGVGSTFKVYLPRAKDGAAGAPPPGERRPVRRGTETVLLVEDEDGVRKLARLVLARSGYTVVEARNGGEALLQCRGHSGPIHLLVTDMVMPNMSGRQVAEALTAERPGLKVLYLSGYTDDAIVRHGLLAPDAPFLQKPFTPDALSAKVREVLG
jgi:PAS domain S-box-containing protein